MAELLYRKLPGHRRGFIRGAGVWAGPDHLLAVNSLRFREEYKRYYYRDIQAITIAKRPRFHLSTRAAGIGFFWLVAFAALFRVPHGPAVTGAAGIVLVAAWIYLSAMCSCTCRIHTAVSQDRLPSVYRTWVARKFLQTVEPQISAIQGRIEQPLSDLETVGIGPREAVAASTASPAPPQLAGPSTTPGRSFSFQLLLGILMANALWEWLELQHILRGSSLVSNGAALLEMAAAIIVLVQHHRRRVTGAQPKLAIATLIAIGLFFYGTVVWAAVAAAVRAGSKQAVNTTPIVRISTQLDFVAALVLSLAGLAILLFQKPVDQDQGSMVS